MTQAIKKETKPDSLRSSKIEIPGEVLEGKILVVRRQKGMLESDLAALYEMGTKVLNQAVQRNQSRGSREYSPKSKV